MAKTGVGYVRKYSLQQKNITEIQEVNAIIEKSLEKLKEIGVSLRS